MKSILGSSLIESMLAITISLLMLGGLFQIFITIKLNYANQIALASVHENALKISNMLRTVIHGAGYLGCQKLTNQTLVNNHSDYEFSVKNKITQSNSQMLTIRGGVKMGSILVKNMRSTSALVADKNIHYSAGEVLIISDCQSVDVFSVKTVVEELDGFQKIFTEQPLTKLYSKNSELHALAVQTFFVADTTRKTAKGAPIFALYQQDIQLRKVELVEGVRDLEIQLDKAADGVAIKFNLYSTSQAYLEKSWQLYAGTYA